MLLDLLPVATTWLLVVRTTQFAETAGARTARSLAGLFGFVSPLLALKEKVLVNVRTDSVHVLLSERTLNVCAEVLTTCAAPVELL